jgi:hypothetical protein
MPHRADGVPTALCEPELKLLTDTSSAASLRFRKDRRSHSTMHTIVAVTSVADRFAEEVMGGEPGADIQPRVG